MKLKEIAHSRTGDKGEISNISLIPYRESDYEWLRQTVTAEKVKDYFKEICHGPVTRYELPGIKAFNFVLDKTLGGGVTRSLAVDKHGKTLGMALLEMEIEAPTAATAPVNSTTAAPAASTPTATATAPAASASVPTASTTPALSTPATPLPGRTIRIGSGAGYSGDRMDPAIELMEKGKLDYIIFECLAERTIAIGQGLKQKDSKAGYNSLLEDRMEQILPRIQKCGVRVITNMGSANPKAAAQKTLAIAERLGIRGLNIAYVTGDDIYDRLDRYAKNEVLENGKLLGDLNVEMISANAYMGAESITKALANGADLVITGRVSDPALTIGPLVYEFGWDISKNPDQLGQAVLAGHLLECAGQVTGGYFADPGYKDVEGLDHLGFPIIEIAENGDLLVTKVEGSGGCVTVDTCKEQMIYEIHNPKAYLTPDAIADFSEVHFSQLGRDLVKASGATSHGRPETLKVSLGYRDCYIAEGEISYGGSNAKARAALAADIIQKRLPLYGPEPEEFRVDYIGSSSLYRDAITQGICTADPAEVRLRVSARYRDPKTAQHFANDVETLYTNGPAGGGGATKKVTEVLSICSIFVPREDVKPQVHYCSGLLAFPLKGVLMGFPMIGDLIRKHIPELKDPEVVRALPDNMTVERLRLQYHLSDAAYGRLCDELINFGGKLKEIQEKEIAEFGVPVDESEPCHQWSNHDVEVQKECVKAIAEKYQGRKGEIIFYGPSNIQLWYSLEQDMLPYAAQNHGMGGCIDEEMITYAPQMLYAFEPNIVFFQTGSNDLAVGLTLEQILENKKRMYAEFLEHMPKARLVVMSGLPLPGRKQFWPDTQKVNAMLKEMCDSMDRMYFMDATDRMTRDGGREFMPEYYRSDGIHLNKAGHDVWTACMKEMLKELL